MPRFSRFRTVLLPLCAAVLVAACQRPVTHSPTVSREELRAEAATQHRLAQEKTLEAKRKKRETRLNMEQRLHAVSSRVEPAAASLCHELRAGHRAASQCIFEIKLAEKGGVNAYADGKSVTILPGMMSFAESDERLAFVLAHELAHNIMKHPQSTQTNAAAGSLLGVVVDALLATQGVNSGGQFGKLGGMAGVLRYSSDYEREADYIGLYILARSGYKLEGVPEFWRDMAVKTPEAIYISTTHPTSPERYVALDKAIAEIRAKQRAGLPLVPEFRPEE